MVAVILQASQTALPWLEPVPASSSTAAHVVHVSH